MNNLFNKNKQLTDKLPDLPEVLDEVGTSNKSERNKMMISLAPESTFDHSDSLLSTMDGECSAIIKLNPPLKNWNIWTVQCMGKAVLSLTQSSS